MQRDLGLRSLWAPAPTKSLALLPRYGGARLNGASNVYLTNGDMDPCALEVHAGCTPGRAMWVPDNLAIGPT